jgi:hypothetical protein
MGRTFAFLTEMMRSPIIAPPALRGTAAKEAFEEAGVMGRISPNCIGMFRATKGAITPKHIEVWIYLLEVDEAVLDWPEKEKRQIRWAPCKTAARELREPVLTHLCHRLAQS